MAEGFTHVKMFAPKDFSPISLHQLFAPKLAKSGPVGAPHDNKIEGSIAKMQFELFIQIYLKEAFLP